MNFPRTLKHQQKQKLEQEYSDGGGVGGGGRRGEGLHASFSAQVACVGGLQRRGRGQS